MWRMPSSQAFTRYMHTSSSLLSSSSNFNNTIKPTSMSRSRRWLSGRACTSIHTSVERSWLQISLQSSCWALMPQVCSNLPRSREQPGTAYGSLTVISQCTSTWDNLTILTFKLRHTDSLILRPPIYLPLLWLCPLLSRFSPYLPNIPISVDGKQDLFVYDWSHDSHLTQDEAKQGSDRLPLIHCQFFVHVIITCARTEGHES